MTKKKSQISTKKLKQISKKWKPDDWERYLSTLEFEEDEDFVVYRSPEQLASSNRNEYKNWLPNSDRLSDLTIETIAQAVQDLPEREQQVIQSIFFEDKSETTIAEELEISRAMVRKIKERAKSRLSLAIYETGHPRKTSGGCPISPICGEEENQIENEIEEGDDV